MFCIITQKNEQSKFTNLQTSALQKREKLYNKNGVLRNYKKVFENTISKMFVTFTGDELSGTFQDANISDERKERKDEEKENAFTGGNACFCICIYPI